MGRDVGRQGGLLRRRQFARPVTAPLTGTHLTSPPPSDQRLVNVGHADPENRGCRPGPHAAVDRPQNPRPQVLRIALPLPPDHHCPPHLAVGTANHTLNGLGIPFSDSRQSGYALVGPAVRISPVRSANLSVTGSPSAKPALLKLSLVSAIRSLSTCRTSASPLTISTVMGFGTSRR